MAKMTVAQLAAQVVALEARVVELENQLVVRKESATARAVGKLNPEREVTVTCWKGGKDRCQRKSTVPVSEAPGWGCTEHGRKVAA